MKLAAGKRKVIRLDLSHLSRHFSRCLHGITMVEYTARTADFCDALEGEQ